MIFIACNTFMPKKNCILPICMHAYMQKCVAKISLHVYIACMSKYIIAFLLIGIVHSSTYCMYACSPFHIKVYH